MATVEPDWGFVERKLQRAGFKPSFVQSIKSVYEPGDFEKVLELNTLLFLRKADYHGPQVSDDAAETVRAFVNEHGETFRAVDARYHVSPEVIAGLMWMESRYGENVGKFHVLSAFVDLLQADRPAVIHHLRAVAAPKFCQVLSQSDRRKIASKAHKRAKWALEELKALAKMDKRDRKLVRELRGSFAGAFGIPQFEPSSYVQYARSAGASAPNLKQADDAIYSVAYYLHKSGWREGRVKSHTAALLKYNHSTDYARAILHLASKARIDLRKPAQSERPRSPSAR